MSLYPCGRCGDVICHCRHATRGEEVARAAAAAGLALLVVGAFLGQQFGYLGVAAAVGFAVGLFRWLLQPQQQRYVCAKCARRLRERKALAR